MVVHCLKCPRTIEYAGQAELREKILAVAELECVLADGPCWLAWAEKVGNLDERRDLASPQVPRYPGDP
jgi:hypothetical protein